MRTLRKNWFKLASAVASGVLAALVHPVEAQLLPTGGGGGGPVYKPLDSWSFNDTTNWTSDFGYAPVSFTNISSAFFGDGTSLVLNTNVPAWLQYNIVENDGTTNLTVDAGTVAFWFAPAWAGTNEGGTGPGQWGRLIEAGGYTTNALSGWWSLYVDDVGANLYFTVQPGDGSTTTYLTAPIDWTTNRWHFIALTYSATNTALYLDGALATNGAGITAWPGTNVLAGGFYIGSDSNGVIQAQGAFDDLYNYNVPLDSNTIAGIYNSLYAQYYLSPWNIVADFAPAPSSPSTNAVAPDVITGPGYLSWLGASGTCVTSSNVWITNMTAVATTNGTTFTFTIAGGTNGLAYDVFATSALEYPITNAVWAWMGQGYSCNTYALSNLDSAVAIFILGTPQDSDNNGLTDAYERLITHTNPYIDDQDGSGLSDGWQVLLGLNPLVNQVAQPGTRANYTYDNADRFTAVSGIKSGSVSLDNQGNVLSVSQ